MNLNELEIYAQTLLKTGTDPTRINIEYHSFMKKLGPNTLKDLQNRDKPALPESKPEEEPMKDKKDDKKGKKLSKAEQ